MHKRRLVAAIVVASLTAGAAVAEAAVKKGTYAGKMSDGATVRLSVDKSQRLVKVVRKGLAFSCSDGDKFKSLKSTATGTVDVSSRTFDISDTDKSDAISYTMIGKFSSKKPKVTGTYKETRTFDASNKLDPNGAVTCETGELTFSAALPKKKKK